jgi:putative Holliday junction resolvase
MSQYSSPMPGRVLAIDWGLARIGLAVSDATRTLATPLPALHEKDKRAQIEKVVALVAAEEITRILVGLPLHLDGAESPSSQAARKYAEKLATRVAVPVELHDERFTSVEAESRLDDLHGLGGRGARSRDKRSDKGRIDSASAAVLLQAVLDREATR